MPTELNPPHPPRDITLDRVEYQPPGLTEPGWSLRLTWTVAETKPGDYQSLLQLYKDVECTQEVGDPVDASADGPDVWSPERAKVTLDPQTRYWIAVLDKRPGNMPVSNPVSVLWQPPELALLRYEPEHLDIGWVPPQWPPFNNYEITLTSPAGELLMTTWLDSLGYHSSDTGVQSFRLDLHGVPLSAIAGRLPFSLRPIFVEKAGVGEKVGVGAGPKVDAQAYLDPPTIVSAEFRDGDRASGLDYLVAVKTPGDTTPGPSFQVAVTSDGRAYEPPKLTDSQPGPDQSYLIPVRVSASSQQGKAGVPAGSTFAALIARADALRADRPERISVGPPAAPTPLITGAPEVTAAAYQAGELTVTLRQSPGEAALVTVSDGQAEVARAIVTGPQGRLPVSAQPGRRYSMASAGLAGALLGPPGPGVQLLTAAPAMQSVGYDGAVVRASWTQPDGPVPDGYLLRARAADVVIAETAAGGSGAALPVTADGPVTVEVAAGLAAAEGPPCPPVALIAAAPAVTGVVTDPVTGIAKVSWGQVPGANGFLVQLYEDGQPSGPAVEVPGTAWTLPSALPAGADAAVTVAAVRVPTGAADNGPTVTGPVSAAYRLPTAPAVIEAVSYNGAAATVSWQPVAGASGFEVSVLSDGAVLEHAEAGAASTRATLDVALTGTAGQYTAVVQVLTGDGNGPPTPPEPLLAPALFLSAGLPSAAPAYIYPAVNPAAPRTDIVAYLPELGTKGPLTAPITEPPFELTATGNPAFPYRLRIPADSDAWTFDPAPAGNGVRPGIKAAYVKLFEDLEDAGGSAPGVIALQEVIARALPQTFAETLYYGWGMDAGKRAVDLRPGMVLRVCVGDYRYLGQPPPGQPANLVNGYIGGPVLDLDVGGYLGQQGTWRVGFDAFAAQLVTAAKMQVNPPPTNKDNIRQQGGVAAAADLFFPGLCQPFYRLFAPSTLETPSGIGNVDTSTNFVLAAADTFKALQKTKNVPDQNNPVAYFRGRAVAVPAARVTVNGGTQVVPLGTTVGNVLDRYRAGPPATRAQLTGLMLDRPVGPAVLTGSPAPGAQITAGAVRAVRYDWQDLAIYGIGFDALALPLLPGDKLTFGP